MRPYHLIVPIFEARELSRTLIALRKKAGLTPKMLAKATNIPCSSLVELENGRRKPTLLILNRLTAALDCEDLAVRFPPVFAVTPGELRRPEAVHLRLQHLIEVVAEGNQRRFAIGAGLPEGSMSPLVNKKIPLTPERLQRLLTALPTLSPAWLMRGEGEAFAPYPTPTFALLPPRPKPVPTPSAG